MKNTSSLLRRIALLALGSALALLLLPVVHATANAALQPMAEKAKALPLTTSFEKSEPGENGGPYTLVLKNTAHETLKISSTIIWSVASHNRANTIKRPDQEIAAGAETKISDLAVGDRVVITAEGYEPLEVKTPPAGK